MSVWSWLFIGLLVLIGVIVLLGLGAVIRSGQISRREEADRYARLSREWQEMEDRNRRI